MWRPEDSRFKGKKDKELKADVLIEVLRPSSSLDEFESIGIPRENDVNSNKIIKVSKVQIGKYTGTYYGEHSQGVPGQVESQPHGKGVFVEDSGWIWVQWFANGNIDHKKGKFFQINTNEHEITISNQ
jgi:hypothetical protein